MPFPRAPGLSQWFALTRAFCRVLSSRMPRIDVLHRSTGSLVCALILAAGALVSAAVTARAYGPQGFNTVIIDAGHGGFDRGGGPGQAIPEKPYTLDTALRLDRALRSRGFRTVLTRNDDTFVSLPNRVAIADSYSNAIFVSVHYNSGARSAAHGYETYYYRSDSFGLASRLHQAQLATLDTEDRHVRRRGFFVVRKPNIPAVLCEGGFLTNPEESGTILTPAYRERWANNIADAIAMQSRYGNPTELASQPAVTTEHLGGGVSRGRVTSSSRRHHTSSSRRVASTHGHGSTSHHGTSHHSTSHHSTSSSSKHRKHH